MKLGDLYIEKAAQPTLSLSGGRLVGALRLAKGLLDPVGDQDRLAVSSDFFFAGRYLRKNHHLVLILLQPAVEVDVHGSGLPALIRLWSEELRQHSARFDLAQIRA